MPKSKTLIAWYSRTGNTELVAKAIHDITGGDMFHIDTVTPYPANYYATTDIAKKELQRNARPALATQPGNISACQVVYLGFPNWWSTMPMCVWTFLESMDWSGKIIAPFCTHGGGGAGQCEHDIISICPGARVMDVLPIAAGDIRASQGVIAKWINSIK